MWRWPQSGRGRCDPVRWPAAKARAGAAARLAVTAPPSNCWRGRWRCVHGRPNLPGYRQRFLARHRGRCSAPAGLLPPLGPVRCALRSPHQRRVRPARRMHRGCEPAQVVAGLGPAWLRRRRHGLSGARGPRCRLSPRPPGGESVLRQPPPARHQPWPRAPDRQPLAWPRWCRCCPTVPAPGPPAPVCRYRRAAAPPCHWCGTPDRSRRARARWR